MALKGARGITVFDNEEYLSLDKLQATLTKEHTHEDGTFTLCFWMYLMKSNRHGVIIRQSNSKAKNLPFLTIDADLRLALHPLPPSSHSSLETVVVVSDQSSPVEKWVHLGCEVGHSIARLHIDGVVTGEKSICFPSHEADVGPVVFSGGDGCIHSSSFQAYAHHVCVLPQPSVTNHYVKNPPLELSLDGSTGGSDDHEVEEGGDGVWSVVGGKASCRRNFALDVVLLDALGRSVHKDIELVAALVYADTGAPVEKPKDDAEAPLLTTFDGVEFPSTDRPIKLVHGRASFKLKISQLSSKCDNRLFRVCFESPNIPKYPFLRVFSRPIRCVSRNRNSRTPSAPWKRSLAAVYPDGTVSPGREDKAETSRVNECNGTNVITASKFVTPSKVPRIGDEKLSSRFQPSMDKAPDRTGNVQVLSKGDVLVAAVSGQRTVHPPVALPCSWGAPQMHKAFKPEEKQQGAEGGKIFSTIKAGDEKAFPDFLVFKYCLETIHSRAAFLRSVVPSTSEEELNDLAARVSQCTGCHHNGYQILIAKRLLQDGEEVWKQVSKDGHSVPWNNLLSKVEESFCSVSGRSKRRFTVKDGEFLQRISGSGETTNLEQFDRLWQWIYPVAMTVASPQIRKTWETDQPKWIEGMISRKESEDLLRSVEGLPKPGTFILRFASSRFWPHPDAGALVISYVGQDLRINHRLLNIDNRLCTNGEIDDTEPLSELLLSQQELCRPLSVQHD